ncbi:hypothetical protein BST61_g4217 [Cercospora zeina]
MDLSCPALRHGGASGHQFVCTAHGCPRSVQLANAGVAAEKALEAENKKKREQHEGRNSFQRFQRACEEKKARDMAKERETTKKTDDVLSGGMLHSQPATQWPGFTRPLVTDNRDRDLKHHRDSIWIPTVDGRSNFVPPPSGTVSYNKDRILPIYPEFGVPKPSVANKHQLDTFTDFAPGKHLPSPTSNGELTSPAPPVRREPLLTSGKDAFRVGDDDTWSSVFSSVHSELELTPESTPEYEDEVSSPPTNAPIEAPKLGPQPGSASMKFDNAPRQPAYTLIPLHGTPPSVSPDNGPFRGAASGIPIGADRDKIDTVASYVARAGPGFEEIVRSKKHGTDNTSFLEPEHIYHRFFKWRVPEHKAGRGDEWKSEKVPAEMESATAGTEHVSSKHGRYWFNSVSEAMKWSKPLDLTAQFQPPENIGQDVEKRELDFLADCVKLLPFAVRTKAATIVAKLRCNAGASTSDNASFEEEDGRGKLWQKFEAERKFIKAEHVETNSALLKRIEELESKQGCQIPEVTVNKLNTLYDKLGRLVDQGVQQLDFRRKSDTAQQMFVSNLQKRIEELEDKHASQLCEATAAQVQESDAKHTENVSRLQKRIDELEDGDAKHSMVARKIMMRVQRLEKKMGSQISDVTATQVCDNLSIHR